MVKFVKCNYLLDRCVASMLNQIKEFSNKTNSNLISLLENMPKDTKHVAAAQEQRKKLKEKYSKYVPGRISLQVLGTGAEGAPRSLYVFSDQSRYLFNCGEGTQRLAHEHKMKLAKLEHIFVTHKSWKNIGGLPGTALTIQDVGVPKVTLHGPKGLEEIFVATKRFVVLRDLHIEMAECSPKTAFQDNVMSVSYVPIYKDGQFESDGSEDEMDAEDMSKGVQVESSSTDATTSTRKNKHRRKTRSPSKESIYYEAVEDNVDYYAHERKAPNYNFKNSRSRSLSASGRRNLQAQPSHIVNLSEIKEESTMCYICKLTPRPGALSLEKCVKLGIQSGPLYGQLKMGHSVTLSSGKVVKSKDVCEPDDPGPVFLVVDCPSEEYLETFVTNKAFKQHQRGAKKDEDLAYLVVHFTPQHILTNHKYRHWVDCFSPSTQHLILNEANTCMGSESVHRVQFKLNMLHETIFPLLGDKGTKLSLASPVDGSVMKKIKLEDSVDTSHEPEEDATFTKNLYENYTYANTFCNFHLRPKRGFDNSAELILKPSDYIDEPKRVNGFEKSLGEMHVSIQEKIKARKVVKEYPKIIFLGTGSCIPNKTRNTSGILMQLSDATYMLLDCGEGTYGQLVRFYGPDKVNQILLKIKGVYVSHLHADHHIGLIGLLQGRRRALTALKRPYVNPIILLAPKQILAWLNFYDKYFESINKEFELIANADLILDEHTLFEGTQARLYQMLEMSEMNTALVRHCPNAFGLAFTHRSGYKVCYSGDTMPSENLIEVGQNCDLLIHEATMEDELENEAISKMHSTTSQAIEVGRNMNARHILLTHFSQRYAKLPRFNDCFGDNVGIAFDNMQIRYDELPLVPLMYSTLKLMFAEHYEELENKAAKRQLKVEQRENYIQSRDSSLQRRSFSTTSDSSNGTVNQSTSANVNTFNELALSLRPPSPASIDRSSKRYPSSVNSDTIKPSVVAAAAASRPRSPDAGRKPFHKTLTPTQVNIGFDSSMGATKKCVIPGLVNPARAGALNYSPPSSPKQHQSRPHSPVFGVLNRPQLTTSNEDIANVPTTFRSTSPTLISHKRPSTSPTGFNGRTHGNEASSPTK